MERAETFWRSYRPTSLKGIHIPLTFHLTGAYGGNSGTGALSSGYMSIPDGYGNRGKGGLAGSGYRAYGSHPGVRVYGNDAKPAWGGWGNGKWGHYGKG
ncbi:glycine-rich cell wall structural protein-like [Pararge aegeria]|nr:glycine-rich cell wall structural protein-like [Pararge aegeria]